MDCSLSAAEKWQVGGSNLQLAVNMLSAGTCKCIKQAYCVVILGLVLSQCYIRNFSLVQGGTHSPVGACIPLQKLLKASTLPLSQPVEQLPYAISAPDL